MRTVFTIVSRIYEFFPSFLFPFFYDKYDRWYHFMGLLRKVVYEWTLQWLFKYSFIHFVRSTNFIHCFHEIPVLASIIMSILWIGFSMDPYCEMDSCTFGTLPVELYKRENCFFSTEDKWTKSAWTNWDFKCSSICRLAAIVRLEFHFCGKMEKKTKQKPTNKKNRFQMNGDGWILSICYHRYRYSFHHLIRFWCVKCVIGWCSMMMIMMMKQINSRIILMHQIYDIESRRINEYTHNSPVINS